MSIQNVTIAGASGSLGAPVLQKFIDAGKYHIRVLKRIGSKSEFPAGVEVVEVDYSSLESVTAALQGQDFVVSTLSSLAVGAQLTFVEAAATAGVKRIVPSEFGSNLDVPSVRKLPVFADKVKVQDALIAKGKTSSLTYTFVYNSAFLDWGLDHGFVFALNNPTPMIIEDGNRPFSTTTLNSIADAVVGIANHLEETKNRAVYIHDTILTQNKILELAKQAAPERSWEPVSAKLDDLTAKADERLAKGLYDMETFVPYLFRAIFDPTSGAEFKKTDNELLGVKGVTDADVIAIIKKVLNKA